jgi:hypothetical protein
MGCSGRVEAGGTKLGIKSSALEPIVFSTMNPLELQVLAILSGVAGGAQTASDKPASFMDPGPALFVTPGASRELPIPRRPSASRSQPQRS